MGLGKVMFAVTLPCAVSQWFSRGHSFGLGLVWAGWHVGGLVLAPLTGLIIASYGWRMACLAIAAGLVTVGLLPVLMTLKIRSPRQLGLGLDGDPLDSTPALALATFFFYATYGGLLTHEASVVEGAGFTPRLSSFVLGSTAGFAAIGGLTTGWILDRHSVRAVGLAMHALILIGAVSLLLVSRSHSVVALVSYAVCFGVTIGGSDLFFVALLRRRFPKVSVAYSYSAWYFFEIFTLLVAGPAAGRVFDLTGNYDMTLALLAGSAVLGLLFCALAVRGPGLGRAVRAAP